MSERDNRLYLRHILDAIIRIKEYFHEVSQSVFYQTPLIQDGVIRQVEIIGEAAKNISEAAKNISSDLRNKYSDIPWKDIAGMRDKLIHDYFGVDLEAVWATAKEDIPELKKAIEKILKAIS